MPQYFVDQELKIGDTGIIKGDDFYHLNRVRRIKINDKIKLRDINRQLVFAQITDITDKEIFFKVNQIAEQDIESHYSLELVLCLIKGKNFELAIRKAVEIGVSVITPLISERSVPEINKKEAEKIKRWQKIIEEAAKQCLRNDIPLLKAPGKFDDFIKQKKSGIKLLAHTAKTAHTLKEILIERDKNNSLVSVMIGPEGGFSEREIFAALQENWRQINLGSNQYRAETAAIIVPAIILYELDNLSI